MGTGEHGYNGEGVCTNDTEVYTRGVLIEKLLASASIEFYENICCNAQMLDRSLFGSMFGKS